MSPRLWGVTLNQKWHDQSLLITLDSAKGYFILNYSQWKEKKGREGGKRFKSVWVGEVGDRGGRGGGGMGWWLRAAAWAHNVSLMRASLHAIEIYIFSLYFIHPQLTSFTHRNWIRAISNSGGGSKGYWWNQKGENHASRCKTAVGAQTCRPPAGKGTQEVGLDLFLYHTPWLIGALLFFTLLFNQAKLKCVPKYVK